MDRPFQKFSKSIVPKAMLSSQVVSDRRLAATRLMAESDDFHNVSLYWDLADVNVSPRPLGSAVTCIYHIICTSTGEKYAGSAVNNKHRWYRHVKELSDNKHHCPLLQKRWNEFGAGDFYFEVLKIVAKDDLIKEEQYYIDAAFADGVALNFCKSAESPRLGIRLTQEQKDHLSALFKGKNASEESRARMRTVQKGRIITEEAKQKISKALTGKKQSQATKEKKANSLRGKKRSEAVRKILSEAAQRRPPTTEATKKKLREAWERRRARGVTPEQAAITKAKLSLSSSGRRKTEQQRLAASQRLRSWPDSALVSLAKEEKSIGEISEKLGSKRGTIIAVAKLLGIELRYERRSPTLGDCLRVKSLHESGLSLRAIAKQYDTNHVAIRRWIKAVS
jgi:group I intron endonuclease